MYATDVRQHHCLMPPPYGGGGVRNHLESEARVYDVTGRSEMRNLEFFLVFFVLYYKHNKAISRNNQL